MSVVAADVKKVASEFETVDNERVEEFIAQAERRTNRGEWGEKADDAVILLTAHLLKMDKQQGAGAAGPVQSEKVGDVSRSFFLTRASSGSLMLSTSWGRRYNELLDTIFTNRGS